LLSVEQSYTKEAFFISKNYVVSCSPEKRWIHCRERCFQTDCLLFKKERICQAHYSLNYLALILTAVSLDFGTRSNHKTRHFVTQNLNQNHGKKFLLRQQKLGTTNIFFVAATKNFAAATKSFVVRTKHFVVVTKYFCYPYFSK